ncbi:MAG: hypothetical protein ACI909_002541 [Planctomycetota bacterium]|jgi:hypothetical protein
MTSIKKYVTGFTAISTMLMFGLSAAITAEAASAESAEPCISISRIQDSNILDNTHVVFQTGVNKYYLNTLPYACNGLKLHDSFSFSTSIGHLCNVDTISVLTRYGGAYETGPSCGLGKFEPITKEEIKTLKDELAQK